MVYAPLEEGMNERSLVAEVYLGDGPERDARRGEPSNRIFAAVNRSLPVFKQVRENQRARHGI